MVKLIFNLLSILGLKAYLYEFVISSFSINPSEAMVSESNTNSPGISIFLSGLKASLLKVSSINCISCSIYSLTLTSSRVVLPYNFS